MRKLLLSIAFLAGMLGAFAQTVPLQTNWKILAGDANYNTLGLAAVSSIALKKPSLDFLYVLDRNNAKINVVDVSVPASPTITGTSLTPTATTAGTIKMNKIRVADDGVIYATSLQNAGVGNVIHINRWSDHNSAPVSFSIAANGVRAGDSFAVSGAGANTKFYIGGSGNSQIIICKYDVDGTTIVLDKYVNTSVNEQARSSISAVSESQLWIESATSPLKARKITVDASGNVTENAVVSNANANYAPEYSNAEYFEDGAKKYLAVSGAVVGGAAGSTLATTNKGYEFKIFNITASESNPTLVSFTKLFDIPASNSLGGSNGSGFADVGIKKNVDGTHTFFHAVFGGGLASYTTDGTLPVSLTSFDAALINGQSTLSWQTASEAKNKGFEVLRSNDGSNFSPVGFVNSKAQNGNSSEGLNYSFVDRTAKAGENYYKLRQVDLDGGEKLFDKVVSVKLSFDGNSVVAFPNPTTKYVTVNAGTNDYSAVKYELFDVSGRRVLSESAKAAQQELSLSGLPASIYYLRISKNNELQKTVKLIKQ